MSYSSKDIAELIGMVAIVVSLVFVGLQLRQSQEIAISDQYQERYATSIEYWNSIEQNEFVLRQFGRGELEAHGPFPGFEPDLAEVDVGRALVFVRKSLIVADNLYFQYQSGFLTEEAWIPQRGNLAQALRFPSFKHYVKDHSQVLRLSFVELCEELMNRN